MTLELRCPTHPEYDGEAIPEGRACADCWELFRLKHQNPRSEFA